MKMQLNGTGGIWKILSVMGIAMKKTIFLLLFHKSSNGLLMFPNPGENTCNQSIATSKGWTILPNPGTEWACPP